MWVKIVEAYVDRRDPHRVLRDSAAMTNRQLSRVLVVPVVLALAGGLAACAASAESAPEQSSAPCQIRQLNVGHREPTHEGMGKATITITVTNDSETACEVSSEPIVEFIDAKGAPVGSPSVSESARNVRLASHQSAKLSVSIQGPSMFPKCDEVPTAGLRAYVTVGTDPADLSDLPMSACTDKSVSQLTVSQMKLLAK